MNKRMTIKVFSQMTGIPDSTLRFYETKKLLQPIRDKENRYRLYSEEQVQIAKLIASLRKADIPIHDIQSYLQASQSEQKAMKKSGMLYYKRKEINSMLVFNI